MQPRSRKLSLKTGLNYHVLEWAQDPAATHTVLLVHGFLDFSWSWKPTVDAWFEHAPERARQLHIIAPDMRGHGDSDRVGAGGYYHFMDYLADIHDLIAQLKGERLSLVGHSMGGSVCSYFAGAYPEQVARMALLEGLSPPAQEMNMPVRVRTWVAMWARALERVTTGMATVAQAAERLMKHDSLLTRELALELAEHGTRREPDGNLRFKHDPVHMTPGPYPFRIDMAEALWRSVTCPVLYVEGSASTFVHTPEENRRRLSLFQAGATIEVIDGAGHMLQRHRPRELAVLLDRFICADH